MLYLLMVWNICRCGYGVLFVDVCIWFFVIFCICIMLCLTQVRIISNFYSYALISIYKSRYQIF